MKALRHFVLAVGAMMALTAAAEQPDAVITSIREAYSQAQSAVKQNKGQGNELVSTMRYTVRGSGLTTEVLHFFYVTTEGTYLLNEGDTRDPHFNYYPLNLVTRSYNMGAKKFYEEYLFEPDSQRLLFVLMKGYDDNGRRYERRFYYKDRELYKFVGTEATDFEKECVAYQADELLHAFDWLMRNPKE